MQTKIILDACCGGKMFHFDKNNPHVLFADIRKVRTTFKDRGKTRELIINPDVIHDFTNMPYQDESFKVVIFDPPHLIQGGENSWLVKKYGKLDKYEWEDALKAGFCECMRVLDKYGTLIFKWNETQIPVSKILKILPALPVIGHKSGRQNKTHWMLFVKGIGNK